MATASKRKAKTTKLQMRPAPPEPTVQTVLDLPVEFGNVSIGNGTARLPLRIARTVLSLEAADKAFCERRLTGLITMGKQDDSPGQKLLQEDFEYSVSATFDTKKFGVGTKNITTGLTFNLKEIDIEDLAHFANGKGKLIVHDAIAIPDGSAEPAGADDDKPTLPGTFKISGEWGQVSVDDVFSGAGLKAIKSAGLETLGAFSKWLQSHVPTDLKGVGKSLGDKISDRWAEFWRDNPQAVSGIDVDEGVDGEETEDDEE